MVTLINVCMKLLMLDASASMVFYLSEKNSALYMKCICLLSAIVNTGIIFLSIVFFLSKEVEFIKIQYLHLYL